MNAIAFWDFTWADLLMIGILVSGVFGGLYWATRGYNRSDQ